MYDVRYIDGRNHILDLVSAYVRKARRKYPPKIILKILANRELLEDVLYNFDPDYFEDGCDIL